MEFTSLKSLLSAVSEAAPGRQILLFGSTSLFASFPDADPHEIGVAVTLDADFFLDPDDQSTREALDAKLGEDNEYHTTHGYYGDFVDLRMAEGFPTGWRERLVPMPGFENVFALHPMDMAVSKVIATASSRIDKRFGRRAADRGMKDINTLVALIQAGKLAPMELARQVRLLDHEPAMTVECGNVMDTVIAMAKIGKAGA
jgi:hypothetical protein